MRLRLFNVKFSPNLGDGLLSECLENALIEHGADKHYTYSVDLAGRIAYAPGSTRRGTALSILTALPPAIRSILLRPVLTMQKYRHWAPHYARHLVECDGVVIGGGNLFTDMDLNFPTKICAVLRQTTRLNLPVAIYGVGVGSHWSNTGKRMMATALAQSDLRYVSVRDAASKANLLNLFGGELRGEVSVVRDPGMLISRYVASQPEESRMPVGVCLTSAIAVRYHSTVNVDEGGLLQWYKSLLEQLRSRGLPVKLFTNGSPEDVVFAARLVQSLSGDTQTCVSQPTTPTELARLVASCAVIVGFRMHALIAGASYGRGLIAFEWDQKLNAFMESIGAGNQIHRIPDEHPAIIAAHVAELLDNPSHVQVRAVEEAFHTVKDLLAALRG